MPPKSAEPPAFVPLSIRDTKRACVGLCEAPRVRAFKLCKRQRPVGFPQPAHACARCRRGPVDSHHSAQRAGVVRLDHEGRACPQRARLETHRLSAGDSGGSTRRRATPGRGRRNDGFDRMRAGSRGRRRVPRHGTAGARCTVTRYWRVPPHGTDQSIDQSRSETRARAHARRRPGVSVHRASVGRSGHTARPVSKRSRPEDHRWLGGQRRNHARAVASAGTGVAGQAWWQRSAGVSRPDHYRANAPTKRGQP